MYMLTFVYVHLDHCQTLAQCSAVPDVHIVVSNKLQPVKKEATWPA